MTPIKPTLLKEGDTVATVSLSWGGAGEFPHRYNVGKKQLQETFGLDVIESSHALRSAAFIARNPKARADDLMESFSDPTVKAIISNIGGDDSIRILPYLDLQVIKDNPKIFLGFSDSTVTHFACWKAGLSSFYGTSILVGFAENGGMHTYQIDDFRQTFFSATARGKISPNMDGWTSERLEWADISLQESKRKLYKNTGWNFLQGEGKHRGRLVGGCMDVLEVIKGTEFWPEISEWENKILFLETSEEMMPPSRFLLILRGYAAQGIFEKLSGVIFGRPIHNHYVEAYNKIIKQVICEEQNNTQIPVISEMDFGHTCPTFTLPYGALAKIDCGQKQFSLEESGVTT